MVPLVPRLVGATVSDTKLMTYAELSEALGIGADSARNLVRRKRWHRKPGNDGLARVEVPVEYVVEHGKPDAGSPAGPPPIDPPASPPADVPTAGGIIHTLNRHIERLEREVEIVKGERDSERARAAILQAEAAAAPALRQTVEALKGALDSERDRARDLRAERDRFLRDLEQQMTRRSWWPFRRAG